MSADLYFALLASIHLAACGDRTVNGVMGVVWVLAWFVSVLNH